jgi:hypothetical protein
VALALAAHRLRRQRLARQQADEFGAQPVYPRLQRIVEHVADHRHATLRPLSHAAELGVVELRLAPTAGDDGHQHGGHRLGAEAVALRQILDDPASFRGELAHRSFRLSWLPRRARAPGAREPRLSCSSN